MAVDITNALTDGFSMELSASLLAGNTLLVSKSSSIDLTGFAAGIYILEVETSSGSFVRRIAKE